MYRLTDTSVIIRIADSASIPADPDNADYAAYLAWVAAGNTPQPSPTDAAQQLQDDIVARTQQRLDEFARTRRYDDIKSLASYAGDADPTFAAEGNYGKSARSQTWRTLYQILAEVQAGTRPMPAGYADIEPELPALEWPA